MSKVPILVKATAKFLLGLSQLIRLFQTSPPSLAHSTWSDPNQRAGRYTSPWPLILKNLLCHPIDTEFISISERLVSPTVEKSWVTLCQIYFYHLLSIVHIILWALSAKHQWADPGKTICMSRTNCCKLWYVQPVPLSGWEVTHISWGQLWSHWCVEAVTDGPVPIGDVQENLDETYGYRCFGIPSAQIFIGSLQLLRWEFTVDT